MRGAWQLKPLGDVLKLEYGKPLPDEDRAADGIYPAYGANGVYCRTNKSYHEKPSIIVGRKGSAGELTLTEGGFWPLDVTYYATYDDRQYDLKFLYYALSRLELTSLAKGVKPGLNRNDVYDIRLPFPLLAEQKRIVAILDEAFAGIAAATANAEKNLANANGIFDVCLNQTFDRRHPSWIQKSLAEILHVSHGFAFDGQDFRTSNDQEKYIVLTPGNYTEGAELCFSDKNTKRYFGQIKPEYVFQKGDLTVVMTDLSSKMKILGKPAFVERDNILHNQRIGRVSFKTSEADPRYVFYFMRTQRYLENIRRTATGTMVRHTAPSRILSITMAFPRDLCEQRAIVANFDAISRNVDRLVDVYQRKLEALANLRQAILQQAFSGELTALPEKALQEEAA